MTPDLEAMLERLATIRESIALETAARDQLYAERLVLFRTLREHGVTHARVAAAAGTSTTLIIKELRRPAPAKADAGVAGTA